MTTDNFDVPYILEQIRVLTAKVDTLMRRNTKLERLSNAAPELGDMDVRLVDDNGTLRFIISGKDLESEIGVRAFLAALSEYGYPTAWMDADTGDSVAGGGNAKMSDEGIIAKAIPIILDDPDGGFRHIEIMHSTVEGLFLIGDAKAYSILYWDANLGSNLISGGDFESGWDSYWNAPTSYEIVDHEDGSALHITSGVLSQEFDTEDNELYLITADLLGDVAFQVIENDYVESPLAAMSYANNFSAWTKVVTLFKGRPLVIGTRWVLEVAAGAGGAYIDNVKVQKITSPVGFVKSGASGEITVYGDLVDKTGNPIGGGGGGEFGSGSDGDATITGGTTTLTRDMYYNNLTITSTGVLVTNGFKVHVAGKFAIDASGSLNNDGGDGQDGVDGGAAGTAAGVGTLNSGGAGGAGGNSGAAGTSNGSAGLAGSVIISLATVMPILQSGSGGGGGGGHGSAPSAGGAGKGVMTGFGGGSGGAGTGTASVTYKGGGGGGGAGIVEVWANEIDNAGVISADGGDGGEGRTNGTTTKSGNGGGGGGGSVIVFYRTTSGSGVGTLQANGGAAGTTGNGGYAGTAGTTVSYQI